MDRFAAQPLPPISPLGAATSEPTSWPTFEPLPYRIEYVLPLKGAVLTALAALLTGLAVGLVAGVIRQWFYHNMKSGFFPLFTLGLGFASGFAGAAAIRRHQVRHPIFVGLTGACAGLATGLAAHFSGYWMFLRELDAQKPGVTFLQYIDFLAGEGVAIARYGDTQNIGYYLSYIFWLFEFVMLACTAAVLMKGFAAGPYCRACQMWKTPVPFGGVRVAPTAAKALVEQGHIGRLKDLDLPGSADPVVVTAFVCPSCTTGPVDIELKYVVGSKDPKTSFLGCWTYPRSSLPVWYALFTVPCRATAPPSTPPENTAVTARPPDASH